jgi:magnesium transporter
MIVCRRFRDGSLGEEVDLSSLGGADEADVWVDAVDPTDDELARLGETFDLHELLLEDFSHRGQRPKLEVFGDHRFVVARPLWFGPDGAIEPGEIHVVAGPRFLLTLRYDPPFDLGQVVERWVRGSSAAGEGTAFLLYVLLDEVADGYLDLVDRLEDRADDMEEEIFATGEVERVDDVQQRLFRLKRDVVTFRRHAMPLRRVLDFLLEQPDFVAPDLLPYYRDITDHVIRASELADNVRDLVTSLLEVRVAQAANRLNEVMKKLTAWAAIILVPTLIAGVYGMNFRHMPELSWVVGYPLALALMGVSAFVLWRIFERKRWL